MNLRVYEDEDDAGVDAPTPDEQLLDVRSALLALGVREVLLASPVDAAGAVLIAEAANRAAKITDRWDLKVAAFSAAACLEGVEYGYGEDGCFYLAAEGVGTICAHDPLGDLADALVERGVPYQAWERPWDGLRRQDWAWLLLRSTAARSLAQAVADERMTPAACVRCFRRLRRLHPGTPRACSASRTLAA